MISDFQIETNQTETMGGEIENICSESAEDSDTDVNTQTTARPEYEGTSTKIIDKDFILHVELDFQSIGPGLLRALNRPERRSISFLRAMAMAR